MSRHLQKKVKYNVKYKMVGDSSVGTTNGKVTGHDNFERFGGKNQSSKEYHFRSPHLKKNDF